MIPYVKIITEVGLEEDLVCVCHLVHVRLSLVATGGFNTHAARLTPVIGFLVKLELEPSHG